MTASIIAVKSHDTKCVALTYDELSNNILTVDINGIVHVWSALSDNRITSYSVSNNVNSMVYEKERIFIASSINIIESYSINDFENVAVLAQFLSEVNHMRLSKDKSCFVAGSDDNSAKVVQLSLSDDKESREITLTGHEGPIISVDIDADCTLVATASCDGFVIIWRARDGAQIIKLPILDKLKNVSLAANQCRLRFSPSSDPILAVPLSDEISLLDCDDWSVRGSLKWERVSNKPITECIFTDDGSYLVAGTLDGKILIWNISNQSLINDWSSSRGSAITDMLWYPRKERTLLFCDASGYWEAVKLDFKKKDKSKDSLSMEELEAMFDDVAEEDFDDVDLDKVSMASTVKQDSVAEDGGSDDENEFNLSLIKAEYEQKNKDEEEARTVAPSSTVVQTVVAKRTVHPPVRPGTTPVSEGMQLLLWNSVGALKKHYDVDGNMESLEVYFHDCERFRTIIVKAEVMDCDMGDVNTCALLLVSDQTIDEDSDDEEDEEVKQSTVYVQSVTGAWQPWSRSLPTGESPVVCCLAGQDYAMVLCSNGSLRYFGVAMCGMQIYVESIRGAPVAMVSSCHDPDSQRHPRVAVVVEDEGRLLWRLEEMRPGVHLLYRGRMDGSVVSDWHPLPLSLDSRLVWIGFSESGALYTVDSKQCVRRLHITLESKHRFSVPRWAPVLDLRLALDKKSRKVDRYFPVGFTDCNDSRGAMAIRCHGSRHPQLVPWPHLAVVPFSVPVCLGQDKEVAAMEGSLAALYTVPDWSQDVDPLLNSEKELLLKLFFSAITQNSDVRALAIARLMPDSSIIQIAIRGAAKLRKKGLIDQLGKLALSKDEEVEESREEEEEEVEEDDDQCEDKENEEEDEDEEEEEEEEEEEYEAPRKESVQKVANAVNVDRLVNGHSPESGQLEAPEVAKGSPFRVVAKGPMAVVRGINVVDKLGVAGGRRGDHTASPKKSAMVFGNFVPSPGVRTFAIKGKRKSAVVDSGTAGKRTKK